MDQVTIDELLRLNRVFYGAFAAAFDASRSVSDPALTCILPYVPAGARVLDVGCGNGRLALLLEKERPGCTYVGLDSSPALIAIARDHGDALDATRTDYVVGDVTNEGWSRAVGALPYDCVVGLALLHHIPGRELRERLLREMAELVGRSGRVVVSTWQFLDSARMRRRIVPWTVAGLRDDRLETGDYLLDWRRGGRGLRFCHLVDEEELREMALMAGLSVAHTLRAGGREGTLSLVAVLEPA